MELSVTFTELVNVPPLGVIVGLATVDETGMFTVTVTTADVEILP